MSLRAEMQVWAAALNAYDEEDFERSLELFSIIAESSKILMNMGLIYATLGEHETAIEHYNAATFLDNFHAAVYFQCGVSNFLLGRYELAEKDFDETLLYLHGNDNINYKQIGLDFILYSTEILFNKGLCRLYLGSVEDGLTILETANLGKIIPEHDVIEEAINGRGEGYTVFSIPVGVLYRPPEKKLRNIGRRDYLGEAQLIAVDDTSNAYTEFTGVVVKKAKSMSNITLNKSSSGMAQPPLSPKFNLSATSVATLPNLTSTLVGLTHNATTITLVDPDQSNQEKIIVKPSNTNKEIISAHIPTIDATDVPSVTSNHPVHRWCWCRWCNIRRKPLPAQPRPETPVIWIHGGVMKESVDVIDVTVTNSFIDTEASRISINAIDAPEGGEVPRDPILNMVEDNAPHLAGKRPKRKWCWRCNRKFSRLPKSESPDSNPLFPKLVTGRSDSSVGLTESPPGSKQKGAANDEIVLRTDRNQLQVIPCNEKSHALGEPPRVPSSVVNTQSLEPGMPSPRKLSVRRGCKQKLSVPIEVLDIEATEKPVPLPEVTGQAMVSQVTISETLLGTEEKSGNLHIDGDVPLAPRSSIFNHKKNDKKGIGNPRERKQSVLRKRSRSRS